MLRIISKLHSVSFLVFAVAVLVGLMAGCGRHHHGLLGNNGHPSDTTAPTVSFTVPANTDTNVPINRSVLATFSEAMQPPTITTATFAVTGPGTTPVSGTVTYVDTTATFNPTSDLAASTLYTATITTGAKDVAGNRLASNYSWTFTTGTTPDTAAPTVSSTFPANAATGVPINGNVSAAFDEAMDPSTITTATFTVTGPGTTAVSGAVTYVGTTASFDPTSALAPGTLYTATITTGAQDLAGNALASNYVWTFTTGTASDTAAPTVSFTVPANNDTNVPINRNVLATFSEAMLPSTITTATFTVTGPGTTPVLGTVAYVGTTAIFNPTTDFAASTLYTATITTGAQDLEGNRVASNFVWTFTTGTAPDTTNPTVNATIPVNTDTGVPINGNVSVEFSEAMRPSTITTATFTLTGPGTTPVLGAVTYVGVTANFDPTSALAPGTLYTATITTGAQDLAGNALASNYSWTFTTGTAPDTAAPTVSFTVPANNDTDVPINRNVLATFSKAMLPSTITTATFTVTIGTGRLPVSGTVTYVGATATFNPTTNFAPGALYTATITTGAQDLAGNPLASNYSWTFTTGTMSDITAPTVIATIPANTDINVPINGNVYAEFSEAMRPPTITTATFTVTGPGTTPVSGAVTYVGVTANFNPTSDLAPSTLYTATVNTGARDLAGNQLASDYVWTFTTGTTATPPHLGPDPIILPAALSPFNILAGSAVTNTDIVSAPTTIEGLVGVFPGSAVSGLPNAVVTAAQIHAGDTVASDAKVALLAAYDDAISRSSNAISMPGNLGGLSLTPGLYVNSTSSGISGTGTSAILHLDPQGDPNAVWIFKMGSTFITDPGTSIVIDGPGQAKNVFWQVGSSATLGTNSIFKGNILASISITLNTGVALEGRALTQTGAVTLDTNAITLP